MEKDALKDEIRIPADRSRSRSPCWWARRRKLVFYPPKSTLHLKYLLLIPTEIIFDCACFTRLSWLFPRATTRRSFSRSSTVGWEPIAIPSLKLFYIFSIFLLLVFALGQTVSSWVHFHVKNFLLRCVSRQNNGSHRCFPATVLSARCVMCEPLPQKWRPHARWHSTGSQWDRSPIIGVLWPPVVTLSLVSYGYFW